jgi:hypothetical protein
MTRQHGIKALAPAVGNFRGGVASLPLGWPLSRLKAFCTKQFEIDVQKAKKQRSLEIGMPKCLKAFSI